MQKASIRSTISSSPHVSCALSHVMQIFPINSPQILTLLNHSLCPHSSKSEKKSFPKIHHFFHIMHPLHRLGSNRTLSDAVHDEPINANTNGRKNWQHLKEKLKLRRHNSGSNWTSSVRVPTSDIPLNNNKPRRTLGVSSSSIGMERASGRFEHTSSITMRRLNRERNEDINENQENDVEEEEDEDDASGDEEEEEGGGGGGGTSLMALLAETDREMGIDGLGYMMDLGDDDEDEDDEDEMSEGGEYSNCCVCMVRHKGAAFIPCGHTFCRLCSRELCAQRGNCPLCNNYILEILDIL